MTNAKAWWVIGAALAVASCGTVAPVKIAQGDQCVGCRRYIHDPNMAGELVYSGGLVEKFRGPACMARYLTTFPSAEGRVYVTDFTSGKFVNAADAAYVPVVVDRNTGETEYRAYKLRADADAAAGELGAAVVDWTFIVAKAHS